MNPPSLIFALPFVLLLAAMALLPVLAAPWWGKHYAKVALGLGAMTVGIYFFGLHDVASLGQMAHEYISFIALVGSLFVVSGGIHIEVRNQATPLRNIFFLLLGAVAANVLGTTGAAMLLIRPWLRMNKKRFAAHHLVFFIFIVANVGGCLTPIGDPPLFLGFLQGVPFWWTAQKCLAPWMVALGLLLGIFYVLDKINFSRTVTAGRKPEPAGGELKFTGLSNLFFLAVIVGAVFVTTPTFLREGLMLAAAVGSWFTTKKSVHQVNGFNFHPAIEVAVLFAGVFATMLPALAWLNHHAASLLGNNPSPEIFYWGTGALSAVLDNAPTYLGFFSALNGVAGAEDTARLLATHGPQVRAISVGAVFFGAATYIGNGPNFLVKAVGEQHGLRVPSFLEFIFKFTLPFLLPVMIVVWLIFFRG